MEFEVTRSTMQGSALSQQRRSLSSSLLLVKSVVAIALYSMRDGFYYELAPFPGFDRGIHRGGKYISCEGKLYVYGYGQDVHVLDLAGQRHWKQCASMLEAREEFGCAAAPNGKIYVTRGILNQTVPVYGKLEIWFTASGKSCCMTDLSIDVHDIETNLWTQVHLHSFAALGPVDPLVVKPLAVVAMNDELLALVIVAYNSRDDTPALIRSGGFGGDSKEISWQKAFSFLPKVPFPRTG